ncbi:MAG: nucleotide exchange factor GrpE [Myxococcales bacterium]|nr:nucleotide exchange factor GrpE [Myxococcales bacterium]
MQRPIDSSSSDDSNGLGVANGVDAGAEVLSVPELDAADFGDGIAVEVVLEAAGPASVAQAAATVVPVAPALAPTELPEPAELATAAPDAALIIVELEKAKSETFRQLQRTAADFDNYRKRTRRENDDARARGREEILKEMLPVVDNLERALAASDLREGGRSVVDGVKLVLRQLVVSLEKFDVKGFATIGEPFDPSRHEAISQAETAERIPGTVYIELQKGYLLGERLLRPAMVVVARAPVAVVSEPSEPSEPEPSEPEPSESLLPPVDGEPDTTDNDNNEVSAS